MEESVSNKRDTYSIAGATCGRLDMQPSLVAPGEGLTVEKANSAANPSYTPTKCESRQRMEEFPNSSGVTSPLAPSGFGGEGSMRRRSPRCYL
jgi:hypothetical protein